ncbi:hypothetical protein PHLCEN_2v13133 [Hermanssonia centrifuga]|uniref:Uncharacterized protein n=1 Tax=Hermanssonia centrifuga TaxID=98765 RepID=A0A2R6NF31_9APHY|nr:hypothetical protein PHLCEN_2v13133 [Hermanssonia centrifuga]
MRSKTLSPWVAGWLFMNPIPFLLHLPAVTYNFVYQTPKTANEQWKLWYFASWGPDIARSLLIAPQHISLETEYSVGLALPPAFIIHVSGLRVVYPVA